MLEDWLCRWHWLDQNFFFYYWSELVLIRMALEYLYLTQIFLISLMSYSLYPYCSRAHVHTHTLSPTHTLSNMQVRTHTYCVCQVCLVLTISSLPFTDIFLMYYLFFHWLIFLSLTNIFDFVFYRLTIRWPWTYLLTVKPLSPSNLFALFVSLTLFPFFLNGSAFLLSLICLFLFGYASSPSGSPASQSC